VRAVVVRGRDELDTVFADLASQRVAAVEIIRTRSHCGSADVSPTWL
jgi:hypothetical protein